MLCTVQEHYLTSEWAGFGSSSGGKKQRMSSNDTSQEVSAQVHFQSVQNLQVKRLATIDSNVVVPFRDFVLV